LVQDQPPEILQAIADEILAIIKSDNPEAKKRAEAEALVGEHIKEDNFIDICNITHTLTDFNMEGEAEFNEIIAINEDDDE
jgi:hypothetical protein